jgi:hypothetical protein
MINEEWRKTKRITPGKAKVKQSHYRLGQTQTVPEG